jgi:heme/copper-type cytochrome/quinol oxidase subunit 2
LRSLFFPAAAVVLVCQMAVLYSVVAGRTPASSPGRRARFAEIAWVVLPTVALIAVLILTWNRMGQPVVVAPAAGVPV